MGKVITKSLICRILCFFIIFSMIFLSGCYTYQLKPQVPEPMFMMDEYTRYMNRMVNVTNEVTEQMGVTDRIYVLIKNTKIINAWMDERVSTLMLSRGMFMHFDDDGLRLFIAHEIAHYKFKHQTLGLISEDHKTTSELIKQHRRFEFAADKLASEACLNIGVSIEKQISIFEKLNRITGKGFYPSFDERIEAIKQHGSQKE